MRVGGAIGRWEQEPVTRFRHWLRRVAKNAILSALSRSPRDAGAGGSDIQDLLAEQPTVTPAVEQELAFGVHARGVSPDQWVRRPSSGLQSVFKAWKVRVERSLGNLRAEAVITNSLEVD